MPVPTLAPPVATPHVGLFDSGIGGLSVLRQLRTQWPGLACTYIADNRHAPYGGRSPAWLARRGHQLTDELLQRGADLVVVACNTATTQTIARLRAGWPGRPFVGVEPGIKPAVKLSKGGRIAVMATEGTLRSARLRSLIATHAPALRMHLQRCPGLAEAIEAAAATHGRHPSLNALLDRIADELRTAAVDTVVLGCTHYPLAADALARRLGPQVRLIDTADAVVRRIAGLLSIDGASVSSGSVARRRGPLALLASGDPGPLNHAVRQWLPLECAVAQSLPF